MNNQNLNHEKSSEKFNLMCILLNSCPEILRWENQGKTQELLQIRGSQRGMVTQRNA
jgi:hypothetical protein